MCRFIDQIITYASTNQSSPTQHNNKRLHNSPKPASAATNSADVADLANGAAVLGVVLRAIEGTRDGGFAAGVDGGVAGAANGELGESVEFDVDGVCGLAFGDGLEFAGLRLYG